MKLELRFTSHNGTIIRKFELRSDIDEMIQVQNRLESFLHHVNRYNLRTVKEILERDLIRYDDLILIWFS
ncbi:hypothetical protein BS46_gp146 [Acinetobacter phage BS46]|nr:hypothetical protein BS46_gp146 [Acinetobacter phage BS46]